MSISYKKTRRPIPPSLCETSLVCAGEDHSVDTVAHSDFMEIEKQPDRNTQQFHIAQQLRFMYRMHLFDRFQFKEKAILNQNVQTQRLLESVSFVFDRNHQLAFCFDFLKLKFPRHTFFINGFNQPRPHPPVDLNRSPYDPIAQNVRSLIIRMHSVFPTEANKANKENFVPFVPFCETLFSCLF